MYTMADDYRTLTKNSILDDTFLRAVFKGQQKGQFVPWTRVNIRPVLIKNKKHLQFSYLDNHKDITKNYTGPQVSEQLDQLLGFPFKNIHLETGHSHIQIQFTKKGKVLIHKTQGVGQTIKPDLSHDRQKEYLLPDDEPNAFLQAVGIMSEQGHIKAAMRGKFRQINAFLKLVDQTSQPDQFDNPPLYIIDFGCGNAYLSFAIYHYFNDTLNLAAHLVGVDLKAELLRKHAQKSQALGWQNIDFQPGRIINFQPTTVPDIVLALHACDTATDEALFQAIRHQSRLIFAAPCCHNHLHRQLSQRPIPAPFGPIFQDGILKARQGDILTDTFRALILRIMGYKTDVIEFISTEHTAKNLMIRAVKRTGSTQARKKLIQDYNHLKNFWHVTPYLETLLGENLTAILADV